MVKYSCEKCGKEFTQKGHYTKHINKKNPCISESKIKEMIEKVVTEKMNDVKSNNIDIHESNIVDTDILVNVSEPINTYKITTPDYTIIHSCCIKGLTDMKNENKKIHLTITSPPYYNVKDYVTYTDYKEYLEQRVF